MKWIHRKCDKYHIFIRCFHRIKMENRTELPKNNDLIHINGELFHENKSKVDGIHIMQTHVLAKSVIILSNKVDMLDKGTNKKLNKKIIDFKKITLCFI